MAAQTIYKPLLRTLGQALESLGVDEFDLTIAADQFIVTSRRLIAQSSWQRLRQYFAKGSIEQSAQPMKQFRYTLADLAALEFENQKLAVAGNRVPDRHTLPQALRVVGAYVDHKQGELLSISKRNTSFFITYLNAAGEKITEDLLYLEMDSLFVRELRLRHERREMFTDREQDSTPVNPPLTAGNLNG